MSDGEIWGIVGIGATIIFSILSWFLSAYITKNSLARRELSYRINIEPLLSKNALSDRSGLKVEYKGELLPEPAILQVDITNSGNVALENPPIEIEAVGATYVIPGYIENAPPGYDESLWEIERTDAESCAIKLQHINPGQVVQARFLLDEVPEQMPVFKCPMMDLKIKKVEPIDLNPILKAIITVIQPGLLSVINLERDD